MSAYDLASTTTIFTKQKPKFWAYNMTKQPLQTVSNGSFITFTAFHEVQLTPVVVSFCEIPQTSQDK